MGPAYLRISTTKINRARVLEIVVETVLGETGIKEVSL
jgi:hypothetical protein